MPNVAQHVDVVERWFFCREDRDVPPEHGRCAGATQYHATKDGKPVMVHKICDCHCHQPRLRPEATR